ncbi:DNA-binding response regulator [Lactobacillus pentosus] [Lactiplantibacillus mudanjiangensis]|uniref:LytR/AlgR family response regulator transcription factor n=1 Tax=Lactiplantibacillus mudanjiangensis TaxID=1296538 RepID=UPI001014B2C4|nr:LytTR family DNA-binding domain-containing protein [Lactiplantibacillus mudanjiangensis]VDG33616.1 DNA-binding response regulator [Lactobacillus pentosus] [Lactiplantibacillus mudanjiangensis]
MIDIYLCEDEPQQLANLNQMITNYVMIEQLDMQVVKASTTPEPLLQLPADHHYRLYFLDIELRATMTGIELAQHIRQADADCKIVFVTTHAELALETLRYQVEPLAFILKDGADSIQTQVIAALKLAQQRWQQAQPSHDDYLTFKTGDQVRFVRVTEILYFETAVASHKLVVHLANSHFEIYQTIKQAMSQSTTFYRCHQSIVVNWQQVRAVDQRQQLVTLATGEQVPCSLMGGRGLVKKLQQAAKKRADF